MIRSRESKRLEWHGRIERQAQSGLSVARFCEQESVSPASFYQWKRRLNPQASSATYRSPGNGDGRIVTRSKRPTVGSAASTSPQPAFVQLPTVTGPGLVELTTPSGMLIRVPAQNLAALELILNSIHGRYGSEERGC